MTMVPLVGMQYRPPAKALVADLELGHPLILVAEPSNEYDPNAIAVYLDPSTIPASQWERLRDPLSSYGFEADEVASGPHIHLGYVSRYKTQDVQPFLEEDRTAYCEFCLMATGGPGLNLQLRATEPEEA